MTVTRIILLVILLTIVGSLAYGGYRMYDYTEHNPNFCRTCHLMQKAWKTWAVGAHQSVPCKTCHKQDFVSRARIVWSWSMQNLEDVPPHTRLDRRVCETCHLSQSTKWKQVAETAGHRLHATRANLQCLSCHYPSLHSFEPKAEDCRRCHTHARIQAGGMRDFHCTTCHNFLAKGKEGEGLMPGREACLRCHQGMQVKNETFPEDGPMTFACAECHKPHVKPLPDFVTCLTCHQDLVENQAHFERDALIDCVRCHQPHTWHASAWPATR
jgi:hypothetical protein